jgi:hypothetical protein
MELMPIDTGDLVIWQRRGNVVSLRGGLAQKAIVTASGQRVVQGVRSDQLRGFHHREPDLRTQRNDRIVAFLFVFSSGEVAGGLNKDCRQPSSPFAQETNPVVARVSYPSRRL